MENEAIPAFLMEYSDSSFTNPHEVVLPDEPKDYREIYTHMGSKYWGMESQRHKATDLLLDEQAFAYDHDAYNWLRIGLKKRAKVERITISTKWFTGNQVRAVSAILTDGLTGEKKQVLDRTPLNPDSEHEFPISPVFATECFIACYYDGGIARINFFGDVTGEQIPDRKNLLEDAKITNTSNDHYGKPSMAVAGCREELHMIGWESARTGFGEKTLFHLEKPAVVEEIIVDTYLHRLNTPLSCHLFAYDSAHGDIDKVMEKVPRWKIVFSDGQEVIPENFQRYMLAQKYLEETALDNERFKIMLDMDREGPWKPLLFFTPLRPDTYHKFTELEYTGHATHILYMHYPNGGIHGLKVHGRNVK